MKKLIALLAAFTMAAALLAGCGGQQPAPETQAAPETLAPTVAPETTEAVVTDDVTIRIAGLKGPTSMGLVQLMDKAEKGESVNKYEFSIHAAADEVTPLFTKGDLDIIAVPANLASVLYNNTEGKVKLLAVNTLGVIYIVEKGQPLSSMKDLAGKTIYATGKGSTPEYALRYLLAQNGMDPDNDVTIEWKSEPTEVVAVLKQEESAVAMLPQPFVTVAQTQVEGLNVALDLTKEWDSLDNGSMLITGVLVVRADFAEEHPAAVAAFLEEYKESTDFANNNVADAAQLVEKYDIVKAAIAEKAMPFCNITYIAGQDMVDPMNGYLQTLFDQNPKAVGGAMPAEDFYYVQ